MPHTHIASLDNASFQSNYPCYLLLVFTWCASNYEQDKPNILAVRKSSLCKFKTLEFQICQKQISNHMPTHCFHFCEFFPVKLLHITCDQALRCCSMFIKIEFLITDCLCLSLLFVYFPHLWLLLLWNRMKKPSLDKFSLH